MTKAKIMNVIRSAKAYFSGFFLSARNGTIIIFVLKENSNQTAQNFTRKNTSFSPKPQQKLGKTHPNIGIYQADNYIGLKPDMQI